MGLKALCTGESDSIQNESIVFSLKVDCLDWEKGSLKSYAIENWLITAYDFSELGQYVMRCAPRMNTSLFSSCY